METSKEREGKEEEEEEEKRENKTNYLCVSIQHAQYS